ncbi:MAG: small ribosomal subunit Rsm22 family protein [Clostridiaceae bacterium]
MISKQEINMQLNEMCEKTFKEADLRALQVASEEIRTRYRDKEASRGDFEIRTAGEANAYLAWRFPVTAMVIFEVLSRLKVAYPEFTPESVLDIGAGPLVSLLPVITQFPALTDICLVEEQLAMQKSGDLIYDQLKGQLQPTLTVNRLHSSFQTAQLPVADLVLASYVVNELSVKETKLFCQKLIESTRQVAVIIVPGTPEYFKQLTMLRNLLVGSGFQILAPCTFNGPCHMEDETDWCHFYERVQRSKLLRQLKSAELSYEDEKFSYLVVAKNPDNSLTQDQPGLARIIRHPMIYKGYREVTLCDAKGITMTQFTKGKHKQIYKELKNKGWGDLLDLDNSIK